METRKSKIFRVAQQAGKPRRGNMPQSKSEASSRDIQESQYSSWSLKAILRRTRKWWYRSEVQRPCAGEFSLARKKSLWSIQAFSWWNEATHSAEGNLLYSKSAHLNINFIQKHPHINIQNSILPNIWAPCSPAKLINKINHHILFGANERSCLYVKPVTWVSGPLGDKSTFLSAYLSHHQGP